MRPAASRTPLAVLQTELELADRPIRTPEELQDAIHHAVGETQRLARLVEELLFLARSDDGVDTHVEVAMLRPLLEQAVAMIRARAEARQVQLTVEGDPTVSAPISSDLLRRAVDNLLENSLRYSPPGSTITVRMRRVDRQVEIAVLDEGTGFRPEFLPFAFERFRRSDDARSREDGGAGLGLAIVLAVAEAHGGTARAGNRPEGGAIVTLQIADVSFKDP